jgi:hypothetical protein
MRCRLLLAGLAIGQSAQSMAVPTSPAPDWYLEQTTTSVKPGDYINLAINCPLGSRIVSGGYDVGGLPGGLLVRTNGPVFARTDLPPPQYDGWMISVTNSDTSARTINLSVEAHCTPIPPPSPQ